jgi:hypothetical protein
LLLLLPPPRHSPPPPSPAAAATATESQLGELTRSTLGRLQPFLVARGQGVVYEWNQRNLDTLEVVDPPASLWPDVLDSLQLTEQTQRDALQCFELFGAPFVDHGEVLDFLRATELPGCRLRPLRFEPTSGKWAGQACAGFQIHVTSPETFRPYRTSLALLQAMLMLYSGSFAYKEPPYEYEFERLPMDLILGDCEVRLALEQGVPILEIEQGWQEELAAYRRRCAAVFLYGA